MKVLNNMKDQGYISQEEYDEAVADNVYDRIQLVNIESETNSINSYFVDELTDQVDKKEPSHYIEEQELVACINHFLKNLPKEHRVMFVRRYWYFDSITEIAERCACSEAKVKTTLFRVRGKLLDYLKKEGYAL